MIKTKPARAFPFSLCWPSVLCQLTGGGVTSAAVVSDMLYTDCYIVSEIFVQNRERQAALALGCFFLSHVTVTGLGSYRDKNMSRGG